MQTSRTTYGLKEQILNSQTREMVFNVMLFMKQEAENGSPIIPFHSFKERVLEATKISESTYKRIMKEVKHGEQPSFSPPLKERQRKSPKATINDGDKETIRRVIHDFYITAKTRQTLKGILETIKQSGVEFEGEISTLRKVIQRSTFCCFE